MQQTLPILWINEEEKVVSFHREENYEKKTFDSRDDYVAFILVHGRCGYKFQ